MTTEDRDPIQQPGPSVDDYVTQAIAAHANSAALRGVNSRPSGQITSAPKRLPAADAPLRDHPRSRVGWYFLFALLTIEAGMAMAVLF